MRIPILSESRGRKKKSRERCQQSECRLLNIIFNAIKWQEMYWEDVSTLSRDETDSQMGYVSVFYYISSGNRKSA